MTRTEPAKPSDNDELFLSLFQRFKSLETELKSMQTDYQEVYAYHEQQCALSLQVSMKSLFDVISYVNKADKALVDWHHRSKHVKGVLRLFGIDRRTHVLIEKKNQKLKKKVSVVGLQCNEASGVFGAGVDATSRLRQDFMTFSVDSVGEVSKKAMQTRDVYDEDRKQVQSKLVVQEMEHEGISAEATSTQQSLTQIRNKEVMRDVYTLSSYGSFGLAAASAAAAFVFPPSLVLTAPLAALGMGSGNAATSYSKEVSDLEPQRQELDKKLADQESSIQALKEEINSLNMEHQRYTSTLQMIEELQDNTGNIRAEVQQTLDRLRQAQMILSKVLVELEAMRDQLEECQYAKTRRDIAKKLRESVVSMQNVSGHGLLVSKQQNVTKAMHALAEIDRKTKEVVEIASLALPISEHATVDV